MSNNFFILKNKLDSIARIFILFTEKNYTVVGKPQVKYLFGTLTPIVLAP
jgi:hypothetical protein